jgi:TolB-like protein/Flp pilus assembly protein TadD
VMDCGDAGHILLSKHIADDLAQYRHWQPFLHDLGECEVKHGLRLHIVNLYKDSVGNPQVPSKLRRGRWRRSSGEIQPVRSARFPTIAVGAASLLLLVALAVCLWLLRYRTSVLPTATTIAEKSIAVLPFANLSDDKQNAYFADAVQDEILTDLAKLAGLKVISRTSVMQYRDESKRNLRDIAKALGVNYALEGAVQRGKDRIRVSAQLIDARTDAHIWADHYDRPLEDVFAIQSEVAEKIVDQLRIQLSPTDKAALEQRPTSDLVAFDYYVHAKDLIERSVFNAPRDEQLLEAIQLLQKAIERDPAFAGAYFQLAHAHDQIYFIGADHTAGRLALAEAAIQKLRELRADSPEVHLAIAKHVYWCNRDYDGARRELAAIDNKLPNNPWPHLILGYIDRRQSRWDESTRNLEQALELDPRNFSILQQIAITYESLRRYPEAIAMVDRALAIAPDDAVTIVYRGFLETLAHGDPKPLRASINRLLARNAAASTAIADYWLLLAEFEHNPEEAKRALAVLPPDNCRDETIVFPKSWCEGRVALLTGDKAGAQRAFAEGRRSMEKVTREQPDYWEASCVLGVLDAAVGHKADAIQEGKRAMAMVPLQKDSRGGAQTIYYLALIYTFVGEKDLALEELDKSARIPSGVTYTDLLLGPLWDPLRSDPRFNKLLADLAPKN